MAYVVCSEVIEHLQDYPETRAVWTGSGLQSFLTSLVATLAPGGQLFLTTPNACSWIVLKDWLAGEPPLMWKYHPRELTPAEVEWFLQEAGLVIDQVTSLPVWGRQGFNPTPYKAWAGSVPREDCLFVLAHK